jgi:ABC-type methionine transport system permease subunit
MTSALGGGGSGQILLQVGIDRTRDMASEIVLGAFLFIIQIKSNIEDSPVGILKMLDEFFRGDKRGEIYV